MIVKKNKKRGILLVNLGTPLAPSKTAVRKYLKEFLSDPKVITLPFLIRWLLLYLIILPFRSPKTAQLYQKIWTAQGSPLLIHSRALEKKLAQLLKNKYTVSLGMRYGQPSLESALHQLSAAACKEITVLPLFPQYAEAVTGSVITAIEYLAKKHKYPFTIRFIKDFFNHPRYNESLAQTISDHIKKEGTQTKHFIFSYHGLPYRQLSPQHCQGKICLPTERCSTRLNHASQSRCYRAQCYITADLLAQSLKLSPDQYSVAFQSRLGRTPWIQPYFDHHLAHLAQQDIKHITVICPSFVADCLETLEEIAIRGKETWKSLGGITYTCVPALNASDTWVTAVSQIIQERNHHADMCTR